MKRSSAAWVAFVLALVAGPPARAQSEAPREPPAQRIEPVSPANDPAFDPTRPIAPTMAHALPPPPLLVKVYRAGLRVGVGGATHYTPATGFADLSWQFELSLATAFTLSRTIPTDRGVYVAMRPELGFSNDFSNTNGAWLFALGGGLGVRAGWLEVFYTPSVLAGSGTGQPAIGVRNSLRIEPGWGIIGLDLSHDWLRTAAGDRQDFRAIVSIDVITLLVGIAVLATYR